MSKGRVLIVEDERLVAADIEQTLTRSGYAVAARAASGEEALERAGETRPDLALMDIVLRGPMDGVEAAHRMAADLRIPVVYLTAHTDGRTLDRAKATHPLGYVVKPFGERELLTALELAFHRLKTEFAVLPAIRDDAGRLSTQAVLDAREQEAGRIAGELHDEAGQLLAALHIAIDQLAATEERLGPGKAAELKALIETIEEQIRRIAHEMRPRILDDLGLRPALEYLAQGVSARAGISVTVDGAFGGRLPGPVETAIYRIAQEALTNAVRHGRPRRVSIRLGNDGGCARCGIRDDGVGFDPVAAERAGGGRLGLLGMRQRAEAAGGRLRVRSRRGQGCNVEVFIPLEVPRSRRVS